MNHVLLSTSRPVCRNLIAFQCQAIRLRTSFQSCNRQFSTSFFQLAKTRNERSISRSQRFQASPEVIKELFGPEFNQQTASRVIYELHKRRVSGSLIDRGLQLDEEKVTPEQAGRVLKWLRNTYPIDEAAAASYYADREITSHEAKLSEKYVAQATRYGLIDSKVKKKAAENIMEDSFIQEKVQEWNQQRAVREQEKKEKVAQEENKYQERVEQRAIALAKQTELLDEKREEKFKKWDELREQAQLDAAEVMDDKRSAWSRLSRPLAFGLAGTALLALCLQPYAVLDRNPGTAEANRSAIVTCAALTAVHLALFLAWRRPELMRLMNRQFMLSAGAPRAFSVLGAVASHQFIYWHLATNSAFLFLGGMPLHEEIGRQNFLAIYFISGMFGNMTSLTWHVLRRNFVHASSGASGALFGVLGAFFTIQPERELSVPFLDSPITYNTWYGVGLLVVTLALETRRKTLDHLVHAGGFAAGVAIGWILRTMKQQQKEKMASDE